MVLLFSEVDHESEGSNTGRGDGSQEVRIYRRTPNARTKNRSRRKVKINRIVIVTHIVSFKLSL